VLEHLYEPTKGFMASMHRAVVAVLALGLASSLSAGTIIQLITNGGFETGDFTGWTASSETGSSGSFSVQSGTTASRSGETTVGPASGTFYALRDQSGPGAYALAQSFIVPIDAVDVVVSFDLVDNDYAGTVLPGPLDYTVPAVEFATADLLAGSASIFSTAPADVIENFYSGADNPSTNPNPYTSYSFDITSLVTPGGTYQIRFGEADNQLFQNLGVDNVSVSATTPEPATLLLMGAALSGLGLLRRKKSA
jgi:hypothetical protein